MASRYKHLPNPRISTLLSTKQLLFCIAFTGFTNNVFAQPSGLETRSGNSLGVLLSSYKYDEPTYMTLKAQKVGLDISSTYAFGSQWPNPEHGWFVRGEFQALNGPADYQSALSGSIQNTPNRSVEARALLGKDLFVSGGVWSPYVGLGYRHLSSDIGYSRQSHYTALPIGVTYKTRLDGQAQLHTNVEYMHLLQGVQKVALTNENVSLTQRKGYGLRLSVMRRAEQWSFGPTLTYWNIGQSEVGGTLPVMEPKNSTLELGFKGAYHF